MSGKIHRCDEEPFLATIYWSDNLKKWMLHVAAIYKKNTFFTIDTPITYCPYCGEKLKEPESDD